MLIVNNMLKYPLITYTSIVAQIDKKVNGYLQKSVK